MILSVVNEQEMRTRPGPHKQAITCFLHLNSSRAVRRFAQGNQGLCGKLGILGETGCQPWYSLMQPLARPAIV